jgi:hypothetical protein
MLNTALLAWPSGRTLFLNRFIYRIRNLVYGRLAFRRSRDCLDQALSTPVIVIVSKVSRAGEKCRRKTNQFLEHAFVESSFGFAAVVVFLNILIQNKTDGNNIMNTPGCEVQDNPSARQIVANSSPSF